MLILTIRTDKPEAEVGVYEDDAQLIYDTWPAHRALSDTIHTKIKDALGSQGKTLDDLGGIVCFEGPGSFTGLRIGLTVADTLAYALDLPIVGAGGEQWIQHGITRLKKGQNDVIALPKYGAPVHITERKK